jgi:SRSO17 transposase
VLDVPCNTLIRDLGEAPAPGKRRPPWRRVDAWAKALPRGRWRKVRLGDGSKGPKVVWAAEAGVQAKEEDGCAGPRARLVVLRTVDREPRSWYTLAGVPAGVPRAKLAEVHARRHGAEELFGAGKGEVGLGHYAVRSWVGWHHHLTLSLLALWFLQLEKGRLGGENPGTNGAATPGGVHPAVAAAAAACGPDRRASEPGAAAERGGAPLPLVC